MYNLSKSELNSVNGGGIEEWFESAANAVGEFIGQVGAGIRGAVDALRGVESCNCEYNGGQK